MKLLISGVVVASLLAQGRPPFQPDLKTQVQRQQTKIEGLQKQVADLEKQLADLTKRLEVLERSVVEAPAGGDIGKAIQEKRLAVGMNLAQAEKAMGKPGKLVYEDADTKQYRWNVWIEGTPTQIGRGGRVEAPPSEGRFSHAIIGDFEAGKLVSHSRVGE